MADAPLQRRTRQSLKKIFQKGKLPTEASFSDLIDSMVNIMDDGINKSELFGYEIAPSGKSAKLLSFFKSLEQGGEPIWNFEIAGKEGREGVVFRNPTQPNALYFHPSGNIGIHTNQAIVPLTVNGFAAMTGRIGLYAIGEVDGDGKYHNIIENIEKPMAFEIVARIDGPPKRGKYAMSHAIATCTYRNSWFNKVRQTNSFYGWPWNRIKLKWKKDDKNGLNLQIKTRSHYGLKPNDGGSFKIQYHITKLWDDDYIRAGMKMQATTATPKEQI